MTRIRLYLYFLLNLALATGNGQSNAASDEWTKKIKAREVPHAKIGSLICLDGYGNYGICTGNEFEKILGFCTNIPFVTVNKAKGDNTITEFEGIASFEKGKIKAKNYLCPCKKNPGQVVRCKKRKNPYAVALETPVKSGALFRVKILGHRRSH